MAGFAWSSRCCTSVVGAPLAIMAEAQLWRSVWKVTRRNLARERAAGKIASVASWPRRRNPGPTSFSLLANLSRRFPAARALNLPSGAPEIE